MTKQKKAMDASRRIGEEGSSMPFRPPYNRYRITAWGGPKENEANWRERFRFFLGREGNPFLPDFDEETEEYLRRAKRFKEQDWLYGSPRAGLISWLDCLTAKGCQYRVLRDNHTVMAYCPCQMNKSLSPADKAESNGFPNLLIETITMIHPTIGDSENFEHLDTSVLNEPHQDVIVCCLNDCKYCEILERVILDTPNDLEPDSEDEGDGQ